MAEKESKFTGKEVEYMANMLLSLKDGDFKVSLTRPVDLQNHR